MLDKICWYYIGYNFPDLQNEKKRYNHMIGVHPNNVFQLHETQ